MDQRYYPYFEQRADGKGCTIYSDGSTGRGRDVVRSGVQVRSLPHRGQEPSTNSRLQLLRATQDKE